MEVSKIPKKKIMLIESQKSVLVDKMKYRQLRIAPYCRVSTDKEEQLTSYVNQKKFYTDMINSNKDWCLVDIYADEGISGTQAKKRPEFQRMIDDCLSGKIDYIITKSVSRFARNTVECLDYVRMLKAKGIGIIFEEQHIDTLKCDSELYLVIFAGFAQSESESISRNITWTYRKKFEDGKCIYRYNTWVGYKKGDNGEPEIIPEEAEIVKRIFNMYLSGMTIKGISSILSSEKIKLKDKNTNFGPHAILNILNNEKYCGDCILQKTVSIDCIGKVRKKNEGEAPMWYVQDAHPAIISREIFNQVKIEQSKRKTKAPQSEKALTALGKYSKYALTDVLKCGECGSRYKRVTWTSSGKHRIVWRCINRLENGKRYCKDSITVDEEKLHAAIVRALNKFNAEDEATYIALMKATIAEAIGLNNNSYEIDLLRRKIEALNTQIVDLINSNIANNISVEDNKNDFKALSDQVNMLKDRIRAIRESTYTDVSSERLDELQRTIDNREHNKFKYDDSIVRQMIECIEVFKDGKILVHFGGDIKIEENII